MNIKEKLFSFIDNTNINSLTHKLRLKRFELFKSTFKDILFKKIKILDVGGTISYWENMDLICNNIEIHLLNIKKIKDPNYPMIKTICGDATNMSFIKDKSFDIVYSNSVIEHVGSLKDQKRMADEIIRIGKNFFVQTPNYYFPIEPHFLFLGFQWLPIKARGYLLRNFKLTLGRRSIINDYNKSIEVANSIRLLKKDEIKSMFPNSNIFTEKLLGLNKSFVVSNKF